MFFSHNFRYDVLILGSFCALHHLCGILHWVGLSCLYSLFCFERPLPCLHCNICCQWCADVSELSKVLFLRRHCSTRMLKSCFLTSCPCYIAKCYQIWDKIGFKIIKSKTEQFVWAKVWYHIDGSV